jgi:hypothetical protein|tara:strand:- start:34 stop:441 length:408 start_codon:yes stop_codon:yes gene_type:complete
MNKARKKDKKKKDRAKKNKSMFAKKRAKDRAEKKKERDIEKRIRDAEPKREPFRNPLTPEKQAEKDEKIKAKLQHNLEVLEALEEEYDAEKSKREELNKVLEEQGNVTIQEKLKAISEKNAAENISEDADEIEIQ